MRLTDDRLDDHLTDEETAARLAAIDRQMGAIHRERLSRAICWFILEVMGGGMLAILILAVVWLALVVL